MKWTFTPKLFVSVLCAGALALTACSKTNEPDPTLSVSAKTATLTAAGDAQRIEITTNQADWKASHPIADTWCLLKQEGNVLVISAEAQTKISPRTTAVTLTAGALTASITVTQAGANPLLNVDKEVVALTVDGTAVLVTITTNLNAWSASHPSADSWCTTSTSGNTLSISAAPQTKTTPRTTEITLTADGLTIPVVISVTQAGATPILTVDKSSLELDALGTAATVTVTTNLDIWSASRPSADDWCTTSTSGNTLSISATLCTVAERATTVTVQAGTLTKTIAVTQKGGGALNYEVTVPTDFSECAVKKVLYNQEKVAEICNEYIRSQNVQMTVIYPVVDGKVDLTQGIEVSTGGAIVWDLTANTCTYTPGSATNLSKVWIEDGKVKTATESSMIVATTVSSDLLVDVRGATSEIYKIVKIGTQYWMAENLRAERYLDGSIISEDWKDNITGAYIYLYNSAMDNKLLFGALYNGFATYNAAGLAPQNWEIPNNDAWSKLRTYIGTPYGTKLKSINYWKVNKGTNIIGFDARPAQNYSLATGFTDPIETWFWSKDVTYDPLIKDNSQFYARLVDSNTSMSFSPDKSFGTFHSQAFGHSVRCLRK